MTATAPVDGAIFHVAAYRPLFEDLAEKILRPAGPSPE
jgi:hypothetical protein